MLKDLTHQLLALHNLTAEQVTFAVGQLVEEDLTPEIKAGFLTALARKGETVDEITAFARELRGLSIKPVLAPEQRSREILDVCGTGGDRLNTFNISTTVALIAAAAGVMVAKHGNRAITSQSGSADVLQALGIKTDLSPEQAVESLLQHHFAFFFAPRYHPAFKQIGPARKLCADRGQRTIFNFLGPLLNPLLPTAQLVGVPQPELCGPMAQVLKALGTRRAMVVSGEVSGTRLTSAKLHPAPSEQEGSSSRASQSAYLDELSTLGESTIAEFYQEKGFAVSVLNLGFLLQPASLEDLKGGDAQANAEIIRRILRGVDRGPKRDAVLLNAGAALFVAGKSRSIEEGWMLAADLLDTGQVLAKVAALAEARVD